MKTLILALVASAELSGTAIATTNAGAVPAADSEFVVMTSTDLMSQLSGARFGNGRIVVTGIRRDFGPISGGPLASVPEPAAWMMLIAGFGLVGLVARRRKTAVSA
nr:PEPxxWA-CTERM sorting domain-containing protein [Sandarakinorhabdus sp.]